MYYHLIFFFFKNFFKKISKLFFLFFSNFIFFQALCFLCGSASSEARPEEEMLLCKSCCEPYHPFCLNPEELPQTSEGKEILIKEWQHPFKGLIGNGPFRQCRPACSEFLEFSLIILFLTVLIAKINQIYKNLMTYRVKNINFLPLSILPLVKNWHKIG